jgi:hypothetical protein
MLTLKKFTRDAALLALLHALSVARARSPHVDR